MKSNVTLFLGSGNTHVSDQALARLDRALDQVTSHLSPLPSALPAVCYVLLFAMYAVLRRSVTYIYTYMYSCMLCVCVCVCVCV